MSRKRVKAKLRLYPDPILTKVCEPVKDGEDVSGVIRDMMHILTNSKSGVGLSAPQAGHLKRIIVIKPYKQMLDMINPEIVSWQNKESTGAEGCLSYPGVTKYIARWKKITVSFISEGKSCREDFHDWTARIIQHEIDHLDGKCKVGE